MLNIELLIIKSIKIAAKFIIFKMILDLLFEEKKENKILYIFLIDLIIVNIVSINIDIKYYDFLKKIILLGMILFTKKNYKLNYFQAICYYITYDIAYFFIESKMFSLVYFCVIGETMTRLITTEQNLNLISLYNNNIMIFINISFIYIVKSFLNLNIKKQNIIYIIACILSNLLVAFMNYMSIVFSNLINSIDIYNNLTRFNVILAPRLIIGASVLLVLVMFQKIKNNKIK